MHIFSKYCVGACVFVCVDMQVNVYMCVHADIKWSTEGKMGSCVFNEKKKETKRWFMYNYG